MIVFLSQVPQNFGGPIILPRTAGMYLNVAGTRNRGLEASLEYTLTNRVNTYANYSFQATPEKLTADTDRIETPTGEISIPPRNRFNAGLYLSTPRFLGNASVNGVGKAFHSSGVLGPSYNGWTDAYTMVNATFGVKWKAGKVITSLKGTNLTNAKIQQHTFGDIIGRAIFTEVRLRF
jgi:outer membrane receptor protein involved in Fe transport